jgi:hypothetical protein
MEIRSKAAVGKFIRAQESPGGGDFRDTSKAALLAAIMAIVAA